MIEKIIRILIAVGMIMFTIASCILVPVDDGGGRHHHGYYD